jgi:hypothetical protein
VQYLEVYVSSERSRFLMDIPAETGQHAQRRTDRPRRGALHRLRPRSRVEALSRASTTD